MKKRCIMTQSDLSAPFLIALLRESENSAGEWRDKVEWSRVFWPLMEDLLAFWSGEEDDHALMRAAHGIMILWTFATQEFYSTHDNRPDLPELDTLKQVLSDMVEHYASTG
jgi:hypothetical protein